MLSLIHIYWVETFRDQYTFTEENVEDILQQEIGKVFVKVLEAVSSTHLCALNV